MSKTERMLFIVLIFVGTVAAISDRVFGNTTVTNFTYTGSVTAPAFTHEIEIEAGAATKGPTAPVFVDTAGDEYAGLAFDADAESTHIAIEVPACWDGVSDWTLEIYWTNENGVALANTETVKWDITWRSVIWGTEQVDNGTAVTGTITYTQSGAGNDGDTHKSTITIDYDHANQQLTVGDILAVHFDRDMTADTYASDAVVIEWHLEMTTDSICR